MTIEQQIKEINSSFFLNSIDIGNWKKTFNELISVVHPDVCKLNGADLASRKLIEINNLINKGYYTSDDSGSINYKYNSIIFLGDKKLVKKSFDNLTLVFEKKISEITKTFLPDPNLISKDLLEMKFTKRHIPLSSLVNIPQAQLNWIIRRMFEIASFLYKKDLIHCGFNPDSVWLEPKNHRIALISFYHMMPNGKKMKTISKKYQSFYPVTKIASPEVDVKLIKRTALWALGSKNGLGYTINTLPEIKEFLTSYDSDPWEAHQKFTKIISNHFDMEKFIQSDF